MGLWRRRQEDTYGWGEDEECTDPLGCLEDQGRAFGSGSGGEGHPRAGVSGVLLRMDSGEAALGARQATTSPRQGSRPCEDCPSGVGDAVGVWVAGDVDTLLGSQVDLGDKVIAPDPAESSKEGPAKMV